MLVPTFANNNIMNTVELKIFTKQTFSPYPPTVLYREYFME